MVEIRRVLCPIDFSQHSRLALDHALAIAKWYGSTVTVLHVYCTTPAAPYTRGLPSYKSIAVTRSNRERLLEETGRFIAAEAPTGASIEIVLCEGDAASEILNQANSLGADLLVIGTHGRSGFERLVLGSVAEKVLRKARCPVLSVPRGMPDAVPATPALFTRILCPVDFSECSLNALNHAMSLAEKANARLTLLHVLVYGDEEAPDVYDTLISDERLDMAHFRRRREEIHRERLRDAVPEALRARHTVDSILTSGKPYREILRVAAEQGNDLIVMGVQGRGATDLMVFGSTTQHVVRQATCPVLTLCRTSVTETHKIGPDHVLPGQGVSGPEGPRPPSLVARDRRPGFEV